MGMRANPKACSTLAVSTMLVTYRAVCRPVVFRPDHEQKLANEFLLYTDADDIAQGLGGWNRTK